MGRLEEKFEGGITNQTLVEEPNMVASDFYVDDHEEPPKKADKKPPEFGRSTSVRLDRGEKPIIIFGQDEAIFNQNSSNTYQWVVPNGERPLLPKNNGIGNMISAFQSRESSRGIEMADEHLHQVNLGKRRSASLIRKQPAQFWIQQKTYHSPNHYLFIF